MVDQNVNDHLRSLVRLSGEMVSLANRGEEVRFDVTCGVVFSKLRDAGYDFRRLAQNELLSHGAGAEPLRREDVPAESPAEDPIPAVGGKPRRVLIVEDDPDIVTFLTRWFEDQGCRTLGAVNGLEAIDLASVHKPDLITLDMAMPKKSGVAAYRDLKEDPLLRSIPVVVITGLSRLLHLFGQRQQSVPSPEGLIAKPIDLTKLKETVQRILTGPKEPGRNEKHTEKHTQENQPKKNRRNR